MKLLGVSSDTAEKVFENQIVKIIPELFRELTKLKNGIWITFVPPPEAFVKNLALNDQTIRKLLKSTNVSTYN